MKLALAGLVAMASVAHADDGVSATADGPTHNIEFVGGYAYRAAPVEMSSAQVAVELGVRLYPRANVWVAPVIGHGLSSIDTNPEQMTLLNMTNVGLAGGGYLDLAGGLVGFAGVRGDILYGWTDAYQFGYRIGPQAGVAVQMGTPWGHPMSIEARGSYYATRVGRMDDTRSGWDAGVFVVGELQP